MRIPSRLLQGFYGGALELGHKVYLKLKVWGFFKNATIRDALRLAGVNQNPPEDSRDPKALLV